MTSPAATIALALMFLRTNDAAIAAAFQPPATAFALDFVRPDFIMLRVLARNLVLWDELVPTPAWMAAQLPDIIKVRTMGHLGFGDYGKACSVPHASLSADVSSLV